MTPLDRLARSLDELDRVRVFGERLTVLTYPACRLVEQASMSELPAGLVERVARAADRRPR